MGARVATPWVPLFQRGTSRGDGVRHGEMPPGIETDDPFLGKSAIFRDRVTIHLPFVVSAARPGRYKVRITAQGCAEERICYSPFPQEVVVNIPPGYRVTDAPGIPAPREIPRGLPR